MSAKAEASPEAFAYVTQQLLRQVAHDIRSPAGVVQNAMEELAQRETPEERAAMMVMANRGVRRLLRLADRLSMVAELQRGVSFDRQPGDLRNLVDTATEQALLLQGRRNVVLDRAFGDDALSLPLDARWLSAATCEVVSNALRFARSRVQVTMRPSEKSVELVVEDDGPGFPEGFDPAGSFAPREGVQGLGLSLAMAIDVCKGHAGDLRIHRSTLPPYRAGAPGAAVTLEISR
jgi:two-component system, OmpR family, sensor histidine kinase RstB